MSETLNLFPGRVIYGAGALEEARGLLTGRNVFLVSDVGLSKCGVLDQAKAALAPKEIFLMNCREPRLSDAQQVLDALKRSGADAVVGVGGGSVLDAAKAAAAALDSGRDISDLIGNHELQRRCLLMLIPTTAGTGSEATCNAIFIDDADGVKKAMISSAMIPDAAVLDPALTLGLPPAITAFTGVDALCHCAESYISVKANELSRAWSLRGIDLILENLPRAVRQSGDLEARQSMLFASLFGGAALRIAGTTAVHALAYPLGKRGVPHGAANSMLFSLVMRKTLREPDKRIPCFAKLDQMIKGLPLPKITAFDVKPSEVDVLAREAMDQTRLLNNHPVPVTEKTAREIYAALFEQESLC
ncbi:MAG: iron-containing alcohol dehydrogenase [Clostridia bacterium]|nr:iron-containing alcohol dehydrogenase [Clostridia bacterium]